MRSGDPTPARPPRRALGLALTVLLAAGAVLAGCGGDEAGGPSISGDSPGSVTVPTLPPTTIESPDDLGQDDADARAPGTGVDESESGAPTTVPPTG